MRITDLKCAVIGQNPIVRITTDAGISGFGEVKSFKPYLKPHVLGFEKPLIGQDPTNVERVMLRIRQRGAFKPWGSAVSAIEMALWDIAGKAAGVPVYKLLGGKIRDQVRVYNGAIRFPMAGPGAGRLRRGNAKDGGAAGEIHHHQTGDRLSFRDEAGAGVLLRGTAQQSLARLDRARAADRAGTESFVACVEAMKVVTGDAIGLALDCGPGFTVPDAIRLGRALEKLNICGWKTC